MIPWILISIGILLVVLAVLAIVAFKFSKKKHKPDYYAFFIIGIIWFPIGVAMKNYALWIMGLVFFILGLANKDKWESNKIKWGKLTKQEKILRVIVIIFLGLLVLAGLGVFLLFKSGYF